MLLEWQGEPHADLPGATLADDLAALAPWQKRLWLCLCENSAVATRAQLMSRWLLGASPESVQGLPARIALFNPRSLPPAQLDLFARLGEWRDVHVYLANPSPRFYWSDLATMRRRREELSLDEAPLMQANGLELGQWIDLLLERNAPLSGPLDDVVTMDHAALLQRLQQSLAALEPMPAGALDHSLQLHACHSPRRQAEVLHDCLLDLFQRDPTLSPGDVLVLCADMEKARPALEAVFSTQEEGRCIPFAVARSGGGHLSVALGQVLDLIQGRRLADDMLAPLACPLLRQKCGLEAGDLPLLAEGCRRAGIVWGRDAEHRAELELPATDEHSWQAGLKRLLLGYAMEAHDEDGSFLPCEKLSGRHALLEGLLTWHGALESLRMEVATPREPLHWLAWLLGLLPQLTETRVEHEDREVDGLRRRLQKQMQEVAAAGSCGEIPWAVACEALQEALKEEDGVLDGLDGRLTAVPMLAGRGVPARVIVLFGLDDQVFPRAARRDELDLCLRKGLPGDRQPRDQDRGQFLDAICCAGDALLIFWQGMDASEGKDRSPSVVTGELVALLERALRRELLDAGVKDRQEVKAALETGKARRHPLQGFSALAFDDKATPSFHLGRHHMAQALGKLRWRPMGEGGDTPVFWDAPPLSLPPIPTELELADLLAFFRNPAKAFLRRAGLRLPWDGEQLLRHEPFTLDHLTRAGLRTRLLRTRLEGESTTNEEKRLRAEGLLPWGRAGQWQMGRLQEEADGVLLEARKMCGSAFRPVQVPFQCDMGGLSVRGSLWHSDGVLLLPVLGSVTGRQFLPVWIQHLLWSMAEGDLPPLQERRALHLTLDARQAKGSFLELPEEPRAQALVVAEAWRAGQLAWLPWLMRISEDVAAADAAWDAGDADLLLSRDWFCKREYVLEDPWLQVALNGAHPFTTAELGMRVLEVSRRLGALWPAPKSGKRKGAPA